MAKKPVCLVCNQEMERGFLIDAGNEGALLSARWSRGTPEPGKPSGEVHGKQFREGLKITAYRCPACEALRLYAVQPD